MRAFLGRLIPKVAYSGPSLLDYGMSFVSLPSKAFFFPPNDLQFGVYMKKLTGCSWTETDLGIKLLICSLQGGEIPSIAANLLRLCDCF